MITLHAPFSYNSKFQLAFSITCKLSLEKSHVFLPSPFDIEINICSHLSCMDGSNLIAIFRTWREWLKIVVHVRKWMAMNVWLQPVSSSFGALVVSSVNTIVFWLSRGSIPNADDGIVSLKHDSALQRGPQLRVRAAIRANESLLVLPSGTIERLQQPDDGFVHEKYRPIYGKSPKQRDR